MTIGERIKERRIALGMTQDELAQKIGYKSRSSVNKLESARVLPSRKIEKMAAALECRPAYLMGWTDEPINGPFVAAINREYGANVTDFERLQFNDTLSDDERNLIVSYRQADKEVRRLVEYALRIREDSDANR